MVPTGSRYDHAHFRYSDSKLHFLTSLFSSATAAGVAKLYRYVEVYQTIQRFEPQVRAPSRWGAMGGQSFDLQIFGHRFRENWSGNFDQTCCVGSRRRDLAYAPILIEIEFRETELWGVESEGFRVFAHIPDAVSRLLWRY